MVINRIKVRNRLDICRVPNSEKYKTIAIKIENDIAFVLPEDLILDQKRKDYFQSLNEYITNTLKLTPEELSDSVKNQLVSILYQKNYFREIFCDKIIRDMCLKNMNNILKRVRILGNMKGNNTLAYRIVRYGLSEGIEKNNNIKFKVNNPGKDHGGKLSAWSKNFIKYQNGEKDYEENFEIIREKSKKTKKEHPENENTKIAYYLSRGYSQEEAELELTKRQGTRRLERFIKTWGVEEGKARYENCIKKWLETLENKPQEEKNDINSRKNTYMFFSEDFLLPGELYYLRLKDKKTGLIYYKIGVTKHDISKRFKNCFFNNDIEATIIFELKGTLLDAFTLEQKLLKENSHCRVNLSIGAFNSTEIFTKDIFNGEYPWKL